MKKTKLFAALLMLPFSMMAQMGKVLDNVSMKSKILNMDRKYAVYLPPDYESSQRSYPVLYLLHGGGDDHTGWVQFGEVQNIADKVLKEGTATSMIIVMPDANTGRRGYFNDAVNTWKYEDFFFQEFMPFIEKTYRTKNERRYRAVAGLSMGGGGAFVYALRHPELFAAACPLSASTGPLTLEDTRRNLTRDNATIPDSSVTKYFNRHSVVNMVNNIADSSKKAVHWYIDCGDDDFLRF